MTSMDNDVDGLPRLTVISFSAPIFRNNNVEKYTNMLFLILPEQIFEPEVAPEVEIFPRSYRSNII